MKQLRDISTELGRKEAALRDCLYDALVSAVTDSWSNDERLRILDVGCGRGELMRMLSERGHETFGLDVEPECVALAEPFGKTMLGGFDAIEEAASSLFGGERIDVVVSSHVLEHVDDPLTCLRQSLAVGARRYVFAVPNVLRSIRLCRAVAGSPRADHPTHVYGWTRPEFAALLNRAGFTDLVWYQDRVTINPFSGSIGTRITKLLSPIETKLLTRMFPMLSSSLIVACEGTKR